MIFRINIVHFVIALSVIGFFLLPTSAALAGLEGPVVDAVSYYNQAVDAAANESYEDAMVLIDKSLEIQPDFYLAQVTKAGLLSQAGKYVAAEEILAKAEADHPDNAYVLAAKASLYVETGKYKDAVKEADKAIAIDPSLSEAWIIKGTAHGGLGEFEEELNASEIALQYDPENSAAQSNLDFAKKAIRMNPDKTCPDSSEKTPLSVPVSLVAVLFAGVLLVLSRR